MRTLAAVTVAVLLAGCATKPSGAVWVHRANADQAALATATEDCDGIDSVAGRSILWAFTALGAAAGVVTSPESYAACMARHGYVMTCPDPGTYYTSQGCVTARP